MRSRPVSGSLAALAGAALALGGCHFYSFVSGTGDLGVDATADNAAVLAELPDTEASRSVPVVMLVHGFSATTYETKPAAEYLTARGYVVSRPLLGGHGTTVEDFASKTWQDWAEPVGREYNRLTAGGYRNVSLLTYSTGGPVAMWLYTQGKLSPRPRRISMVAPILDFRDRLSGAAGVLRALGARNSPSKQEGSSKGHWYSDRPIEAVLQLIDLTEVMKGLLRGGIRLPADMRIQIFQSMGDRTVDPFSAQLWANGLIGGLVAVNLVESDIHVPIGPDFTDEAGTNKWRPEDRALRARILEQVAAAHCPGDYTGGRCREAVPLVE